MAGVSVTNTVDPTAQEEPVTTSKLTKLFNQFSMNITAILDKFKTDASTNAVTAHSMIEFVGLLQPSIANMLESVNAGIRADIAEAETGAITKVTDIANALEGKYKDTLETITNKLETLATAYADQSRVVNEQATTISNQATTIDNLAADVERLAGRPAPAAGSEPAGAVTTPTNSKPTFRGRTTPVNVAD